MSTKRIALIGVLSAAAYVVTLVAHLVPVTVAGFLKYDPKDIVIVMGGFMLGPVTVCAVSAIVSLIEMLTISTTGWIGLVMNVISTLGFALPGAFMYRGHNLHTRRGAVIGLAIGIVAMTALMLLWNWLITPLYMNVPREVVKSMLLPTFLPFNLAKSGINAVLTFLLYKPIVGALRRAKML